MYKLLTFGYNNSIILLERKVMSMKTKRYFKLILKPYNVILKHFKGDRIRISIGQKFCCFPQLEEREIEIPIFENKRGRQAFYNKMLKRLKEFGIEETYSSELLSFLHELGHIYTYNKINNIKYNIGTVLIQKIQAVFVNPKYLDFFYNLYFNLALEKNADKWTMNFIKNNLDLVKEWDIMLTKNYQKVMPKFINHMKYKTKIDLLAE